jgi:hypothetical protein
VDSDAAGRGPKSGSETDARWGMTRGPHLAASAGEGEWRRAGGGCRVGWRRNAWPAGPKERRRKRASKGDRGVSAEFAHRVSKLKQARRGED